MNRLPLAGPMRIFPVRRGNHRSFCSMIGRPKPPEASDERHARQRPQPRDRPHPDQEARGHPCRLPAGQRDQLFVPLDEGRPGDPPRRGQPRGPRLLDRCRIVARRRQAADPDPEHRHARVGGFDPRLADEPQRADRADGRLSRLDPARRNHRHGGDLYRALPDGVRPQLLPGRERRRFVAHRRRLRRSRAHQTARCRPGRRRISRLQPVKGRPAMMHTVDMMKAVASYRGDAILVPGRSGRYWITISDNQPLDVELGDPSMGGHAGLGLGLALARPDKKVMLFDSEGDILMSLGILATVAEQAPPNLYHFLIDNGVYATTGGQPVPNADNIQYDMIARGCGYPRTYAFTEIGDFERALPEIMGKPGPVFVACKVVPEIENEPIGRRRRWQTRTRDEVVVDLRAALATTR